MGILELNEWQSVLLALIASGLTAWYFLPRVIKVTSHRQFADKPGKHKIHKKEIPTFGGIGIFAGFSFGFLLGVNGFMEGISFLTAAIIILFFMGLRDDLMTVNPVEKIIMQGIAGLILWSFTRLHFTNLHGFLGISEIPEWASFILTVFLIVIIINAYNLIDGIDGLAASVGIIASMAFGTWFWLSGDTGYAVIAAALNGTLIVFLVFNFSEDKRKIFMGDTGSLVVGFLLTVMAIRFNEINAGTSGLYMLDSSPTVSIAILIVPLFDALRVILIRLIRGRSPLKADNRHIHHLMLRAGYSHKQTTLIISIANIFLIITAFLFDGIGILWLGLVMLILCSLFTVPVYIMVARKEHWNCRQYKIWQLIASEQNNVVAEEHAEGGRDLRGEI